MVRGPLPPTRTPTALQMHRFKASPREPCAAELAAQKPYILNLQC